MPISTTASEASLNNLGAAAATGPAGSLLRSVPRYVLVPPIEAVVFGWGVNEDGQIGLEGNSDVSMPKVIDTLLGLQFSGRTFLRTPLVAGSRNTVAIDSHGGLWSWGWNDRGTLGHGHRGVELKPRRLAQLKGVRVVQAAIGGWHCLALTDNGQIFGWGGNEYLQCGVALNSPQERDIVTPVPVPLPGQVRVRQVACGGMHSLALAEDGSVWTWGEPWGDFSFRLERRIKQVPGAAGISAIACGAFHNMALTTRGEVLTWGTNDYGQLGNGHTAYCVQPTRVLAMDHVLAADIAAGGWHSAAITTSGEVYIWGRGEYGRLGIGDRTGSSKLKPQKLRALEGQMIVQLALGGTHSIALTNYGRAFIWGRGSFGRLGLGPTPKDHYLPVELPLPGGAERWRVAAVAAGGRHSLALCMPVRETMPGSASEAGSLHMMQDIMIASPADTPETARNHSQQQQQQQRPMHAMFALGQMMMQGGQQHLGQQMQQQYDSAFQGHHAGGASVSPFMQEAQQELEQQQGGSRVRGNSGHASEQSGEWSGDIDGDAYIEDDEDDEYDDGTDSKVQSREQRASNRAAAAAAGVAQLTVLQASTAQLGAALAAAAHGDGGAGGAMGAGAALGASTGFDAGGGAGVEGAAAWAHATYVIEAVPASQQAQQLRISTPSISTPTRSASSTVSAAAAAAGTPVSNSLAAEAAQDEIQSGGGAQAHAGGVTQQQQQAGTMSPSPPHVPMHTRSGSISGRPSSASGFNPAGTTTTTAARARSIEASLAHAHSSARPDRERDWESQEGGGVDDGDAAELNEEDFADDKAEDSQEADMQQEDEEGMMMQDEDDEDSDETATRHVLSLSRPRSPGLPHSPRALVGSPASAARRAGGLGGLSSSPAGGGGRMMRAASNY